MDATSRSPSPRDEPRDQVRDDAGSALVILILEDNADDAALMKQALHAGGLAFSAVCVQTRDEFVHALETERPQVILADYRLPNFDGLSAIKLAAELLPQVPVIIVTGVMNDESAVQLLREGAVDYILKDRLSRLAAAVRRALQEAKSKTERLEVEQKYRALFESARDGIVLAEFDSGRVVECNPEFERQAGRGIEQLRQARVWELCDPQQADQVQAAFRGIRDNGHTLESEMQLQRSDGSLLAVEFRGNVLELGGRQLVQSQVRDITERREAQRKLEAQIDELRRFQQAAVDRELRMEELEQQLAERTRHGAEAK
jgi:PAS domain S-box-containing protein